MANHDTIRGSEPLLDRWFPGWFSRSAVASLRLPRKAATILAGLPASTVRDLARVTVADLSTGDGLKEAAYLRRALDDAFARGVERSGLTRPDWVDVKSSQTIPKVGRPTAPRRQRPLANVFPRPAYEGPPVTAKAGSDELDRSRGGGWTKLQERYVRLRWADGLKCVEIGREMRTSKNAILSKLYRLGLLANGEPVPYVRPVR